MASFSTRMCPRSASSWRARSYVVTACGFAATRWWTAAAGSGQTCVAAARRPRLVDRRPEAARARWEVWAGDRLSLFAEATRVAGTHVSRFSADGVRSNSDATHPSVSLAPGGMVAPCGMGGGPDDNDDDNNVSHSLGISFSTSIQNCIFCTFT